MASCLAMTLPVAIANDGDPIPAAYEELLCGFPQVRSALAALPPSAGRCATDRDFTSPLVTPAPCAECSRSPPHRVLQDLTPAADVPAILLPPVPVPSLRPVPQTPAIDHGVAGVSTRPSGKDVCVDFHVVDPITKKADPHTLCVNVGEANAQRVGANGPHNLLYVAPIPVPATPGVGSGALGATPGPHVPATRIETSVSFQWVESHLSRRASLDSTAVWDPVDYLDPAEVQWWAQNGEKTTLDLTFVLHGDGAPLAPPVELHLPYLGQVLAATLKTLEAIA